uniref:Uncharacterized protein n=1 Tax=Rhizophagus irregularis (strain DAOM 181602 / DAOM 197198 / MUCL 43194) TaxID=747089 RepID=U9UMX0_RHIID
MHQDYLFYRNPGLYKPDDYRIKYELIDDTSSNSNLIDQYILESNISIYIDGSVINSGSENIMGLWE